MTFKDYNMVSLEKNGQETAKNQARAGQSSEIVPRTITKAAFRAYFRLSKRRYKHTVTPQILQKMGVSEDDNKRKNEFDVHETRILIEELQLTRDELIGIGKYM